MRFLRRRPIPILVALLSALLVGCIWIAGGAEEILAAVPVLALLVALACNRYPGEELIEVLAQRLRRRRMRPLALVGTVCSETPGAGHTLRLLAAGRPLRGPPLLSSLAI